MEQNINGKNILLIGIGFYDYENVIINELKKRGANVYYINAVCNSLLKKILIRTIPYLSIKLENYLLHKKLVKSPCNIDKILILKGESFNKENIHFLKEKYKDAKILLYLWDSIIRIKNSSLLLDEFDNILTFDRVDSVKYNLKFRPLFYRTTEVSDIDYKYDISFVGWMHSNRYRLLHLLRLDFEKHGLNYKIILYTGIFSYLINRYIKRIIDKNDIDLFIFKPISYKEYIAISSSSKVILDLAHPLQSGLTMRTVETIGLKRKILTNNSDILNYPMLNSKNYQIFNSDTPTIDYSLLTDKYIETNTELFTLNSFLEELLANM